MEVRLIGRKWKTDGNEIIDGFKVINVELELAFWENNEPLFNFIADKIMGGFPICGDKLYIEDLTKISEFVTSEEDKNTMEKVKMWYNKNYLHGGIIFEFG